MRTVLQGIKMWKIDFPKLGGLDFLNQIAEWNFLGNKFFHVSISSRALSLLPASAPLSLPHSTPPLCLPLSVSHLFLKYWSNTETFRIWSLHKLWKKQSDKGHLCVTMGDWACVHMYVSGSCLIHESRGSSLHRLTWVLLHTPKVGVISSISPLLAMLADLTLCTQIARHTNASDPA